MLKTLNMALARGPAGLSEKIIAVFQLKKTQMDTEKNKKSQNFPNFKDFLHFPQFSTDCVDWNVGKGQQGKNVSSSMLREEINATETARNRHRKRQICENFSIFTILIQFLLEYRYTSWTRTLKRLTYGQTCFGELSSGDKFNL